MLCATQDNGGRGVGGRVSDERVSMLYANFHRQSPSPLPKVREPYRLSADRLFLDLIMPIMYPLDDGPLAPPHTEATSTVDSVGQNVIYSGHVFGYHAPFAVNSELQYPQQSHN